MRLLPIGDVYEQGGATWQQYKCIEKPNTEDKRVYIAYSDSETGLIVSIRQTSSSDAERKIGEIFEYNGEWYQCLKGISCKECDFSSNSITCDIHGAITCTRKGRSDDTSVVFKKLEKVGEPVTVKGRTFQKLTSDNNSCKECVFNVSNKACCKNSYIEGICDDNGFWIEIKQNKEDMEEKKNNYDGNMDKECIPICDALNSISDVHTEESCCGHCKDRFMIFLTCNNSHSLALIARVFDRRYIGTSQPWHIELQTKDSGSYDYFIHSETKYSSEEVMIKDVNKIIENIKYWSDDKFSSHFKGRDDTKHSNFENIGKNLREFDLEAAKSGKPVCTRDGRKVRILCYDRNAVKYHIVALIECKGFPNKEEEIKVYDNDGKYFANGESPHDLMMLPERKEGWINIYPNELKIKSCLAVSGDKVYPTKEIAEYHALHDCIATVPVEWQE